MPEVVDIAPVGEKGQMTIPREVRNLLEVKPGDRIVFLSSKDREIVMRKSKTNQKLSEILSRGKPIPESSISFQRKLRKEWRSQSTQTSSSM